MTLEENACISEKKGEAVTERRNIRQWRVVLYVSSAKKYLFAPHTQKHSVFRYIWQKAESVIGLNTVKNKRVDYPLSMHPVALKTHLHSNYFQGK